MITPEPQDYEDLQEKVASLLTLARTALESDERASSLAAALPVLDNSPVRIAVAGPHNAGKSMLIAALLKLPQDEVDEITAATPRTSAITPYDWLGHVLLDLPGTLSGLDEHDVEAAAGVRRADLLLLVTSVELPGEAETLQINTLLAEEGFAHRTLVVVNKCNSEESDLEVIRAEMLARLTPYPRIEMLFADAKDNVDSRNFPDFDQEDRDFLREASGIDEVEAALSSLAVEHGRTARLQALCHEVRRASAEASSLWVPDGDEETLEAIADRIQLAIANARTELTDATNLALETLGADIAGIGTSLASSVSEEDGAVDTKSVTEAEASEKKAFAQYGETVNRIVKDVVARLDEQLGTAIEDWDRYSVGAVPLTPEAQGSRDGTKRGKTDDAVDQAVDSAMRAARRKLDDFVRGGVRAGSPAHNLAKKWNVARKKPIVSHTHIHTAEKLTKAGKYGGNAAEFLSPFVDVKKMVDNLRRGEAVKKRREGIRSRYSDQARIVVADEREAIDAYIEGLLGPRLEAVTETLESADESAQARTQAQAGWGALSEQAQELAAVIDQALVR